MKRNQLPAAPPRDCHVSRGAKPHPVRSTRSVVVEALEGREMFSASPQAETIKDQLIKQGTLASKNSTQTFTVNMTQDGWLGGSWSAPPYFSNSVVITDASGTHSYPGNLITAETAANKLKAGIYNVVITRTDNAKGAEPFKLSIFADHAGPTQALARDGGNLNAATPSKSFTGTVTSFPGFGGFTQDYYKFHLDQPGTINVRLTGAPADEFWIICNRNNQVVTLPAPLSIAGVRADLQGSAGGLVQAQAGDVYIAIKNYTGGGVTTPYSLTVSTTPLQLTPRITWSMADRYGPDVDSNKNHLTDLPNSYSYVNPNGYTVNVDASATQSNDPNLSYKWTLSGGSLGTRSVTTSGVKSAFYVPQGTYNLALTVTNQAGVAATTSQSIRVRDILIVALGDSYGSGEGNPEVATSGTKGPLWADGVSPAMTEENLEAHRSTLCDSSQAAIALEASDPHSSVTYVNLCESGATIDAGMLGGKLGIINKNYKLQPEVNELQGIVGTRKIDDLSLSIGGNDFGFSSLIGNLVLNGEFGSPSKQTIDATAKASLATLPGKYNMLAQKLNPLGAAHTFITGYPDLTYDQNQQHVPFATDVILLGRISAAGGQFASQTLLPELNNAVAHANQNWTFENGFAADFLTHGYPSSDPWFRTETTAKAAQGDDSTIPGTPIGVSSGAFHPNAAGHQDMAKYLYKDYLAAANPSTNLG